MSNQPVDMLANVNVIIGDISDREIDLIFGPIDRDDPNDQIVRFPIEAKMPNILKETGFFTSTGQARKAGWDMDVPEGFSEFQIGKRKRKLTIFKKED